MLKGAVPLLRQFMLVNDLILPARAEPVEARSGLRILEKSGAVIGTDEAGRGALAGPVVAAAAVLTREQEEALLAMGLKDSKKVTALRREKIFKAMNDMGVLWRAYMGSPESVDNDGISAATLRTMKECVNRLARKVTGKISCVIVDGTEEIPGIDFHQWALIRADDLIPCVSAASIAAKVIRDRLMIKLADKYPEYGFTHNKGYPTKFHMKTVMELGMTDIHRESFCRKIFLKGERKL